MKRTKIPAPKTLEINDEIPAFDMNSHLYWNGCKYEIIGYGDGKTKSASLLKLKEYNGTRIIYVPKSELVS